MNEPKIGINFNNIATSLEIKACHVFGIKIEERNKTCFTSYHITQKYFYIVMQAILLKLANYRTNNDINKFIELCNENPQFNTKHSSPEEIEKCNYIYKQFEAIYNKLEKGINNDL